MQTLSGTSLKDDIRDFNWDFAPLWEWFKHFVSFHYHQYGWVAVAVIVVSIILLALNTDAFKGTMTLILANLYKQISDILKWIVLGVFGLGFVWLKNMSFSKLHHALRSIASMGRHKD